MMSDVGSLQAFRRGHLWLWLSPWMLLAAILFGTAIGETRIPLSVVMETIANRLWDAGYPVNRIDEGIIWSYRLSRAIVAAACGAGLALTGVVLQALLRNPLADPYLMGLSAGASTGAVVVTVAGLGAGAISMSLGALIGALVAFALVAMLAQVVAGRADTGRGSQAAAIILAGIAGSQLFNALTAFIIARTANAEQARGIMFWLMGNLSGTRWEDVGATVLAALAGAAVCFWHRRSLDAFTFGADSAASLGIAVRPVRGLLITVTAVMIGVMVSKVGSIGFVGLVVPHAMRFLVGTRHDRLVPATALAGAIFLVVADVLSRVIVPGQVLPIGVITALVGAPAFALILVHGRRAHGR